MFKEPFDAHIKRCLKTELNQPILKLAKDTNPSLKECYDVSRILFIFLNDLFLFFYYF